MWTLNTTLSVIVSSNMQTSPTRKLFSLANADQPTNMTLDLYFPEYMYNFTGHNRSTTWSFTASILPLVWSLVKPFLGK